MGLHICEINGRYSEQSSEWVLLANDGPTAVSLFGLALTDDKARQKNAHVLRLPDVVLPPRGIAYVFTEHGTTRSTRAGRELHLYANRRLSVWNTLGVVVYLRFGDGRLVDKFTVGSPARHRAH